MLVKDFIRKLNKKGKMKVFPLIIEKNDTVQLSTTDMIMDFGDDNIGSICSDFTQNHTSINKEFVVTNKMFSMDNEIDNKKITLKMFDKFLDEEIVDVNFHRFDENINIKFYKGIGTMNFIIECGDDFYTILSLIVKSEKEIPTGRLLPFK
jgi:hypothetical protein